ncbi:MAG: radical SAM protein [candidate division WOR-3 bacterium]
MKEIYLISAPILLNDKEVFHYIPLGLLSLASYARKYAHPVIIDLNILIENYRLSSKKYLSYEIADFLSQLKGNIYGFSTLSTSYPLILNICKNLKNMKPDSIIILGGPQASAVSVETLKNFCFIDIIVRGEGEVIFENLLSVLTKKDFDFSMLKNIKGITFLYNGKIINSPDENLIENLDTLLFPFYEIYPHYKEKKYKYVFIEVGRGCPYNCKFCFTSTYWKRKMRFKSVTRVIEEIEYVINYLSSLGIEDVDIELQHDCLTANKKFIQELCHTLRTKNYKLKWGCTGRIDHIDENLLDTLSNGNCRRIFYGIESGSSRMQSFIGKNLDVKNIIEVIKLTLNKKIMPTSSFIVGFPEEKYRDLEETFSLMLKIKLLGSETQCHMFTIFPETTFHKEYKSHLSYDGYISDMNSTILTKEDYSLIRKYKDIFSDFYFIPGFIKRDLIIASSLFYEFVSQFFLESIISLKYKDKYDFLHIVELWRKFLFNNKYIISFENFNPNFHLNEIFMYILTFFSSLIYSQKIKMSLLSREILKYQVAKNTLIFDNKKNYWMGTFNYKIPDLKIFINEKNEVEIKCPKVNIICIMNKIKGKLKIYILPMNKSFLLKNQNEKI